MADTRYVEQKDLPKEIQSATRSAIRVHAVIKDLAKEVELEKSKLENYTTPIKEYLERTEFQGISAVDNTLFLQEMTRVPSFKQVFESLRAELPAEVVTKLENAYNTLTSSNGKRLVIK